MPDPTATTALADLFPCLTAGRNQRPCKPKDEDWCAYCTVRFVLGSVCADESRKMPALAAAILTPAALAEALHDSEAASNWCEPDASDCDWMQLYRDKATALLAALREMGEGGDRG